MWFLVWFCWFESGCWCGCVGLKVGVGAGVVVLV